MEVHLVQIMRPKLSIKLINEEKDDFLKMSKVILDSSGEETEEGLYYLIPEENFKSTGLDLINTLLLGLSKVVDSDEGIKALLTDVRYTKGEAVELWVDAQALNTVQKYLKRKEQL